jgi:Right handed beta helix region
VLREHRPSTDVQVRIKQGTYVAPPFHEWRFYIPGRSIAFMPINYTPGEGVPAGGLPIFRNARCGSIYCNGVWLQPRLPRDTADPMYDGGVSGLRFYYLQVDYYSAGGISIYGDSERDVADENYSPPLAVPGSKGLNGNTIFGMQFRNLGNKWSLGTFGYGAVVLTNSSNNRIENNHFVNIENTSSYPGLIHGVYVTHFSKSNSITRNRFENISGDPVKVRNQSNFTVVENNTFTRTGRISYYRGEFCDRQCAIDNAPLPRQCASYGNRFFNNVVRSGYNGGRISNWSLGPEGNTYAGVAPCSIPEGQFRISTGGNTSS